MKITEDFVKEILIEAYKEEFQGVSRIRLYAAVSFLQRKLWGKQTAESRIKFQSKR